MIDDAIEQIVAGFSDKAILRLDIEEDDPRLSRVCDDMRQTVRAILSRLRGEAVLEDCDIAWLWKVHADAQSKGLHADQRKIERILAALTTPAPAAERDAVLDICSACNGSGVGVADTLCVRCTGCGGVLTTPAPEDSATEIAEKARSFAKSKTKLLREVVESRRTTPAPTSELEAVLEEGNKRGLYDTTKIGPELVAFLDDRRGMLAALRDEMSEGYRGWLDDAVEALQIARDHLAALHKRDGE